MLDKQVVLWRNDLVNIIVELKSLKIDTYLY